MTVSTTEGVNDGEPVGSIDGDMLGSKLCRELGYILGCVDVLNRLGCQVGVCDGV
jgi:hypothetical protein